MKVLEALAGGLAGACVLTIAHESLRRVVPEAPRMDILGMRAIAKLMEKAGQSLQISTASRSTHDSPRYEAHMKCV